MSGRPSPFCRSVLAEATALAPTRNRASDGIVGDADHAARSSDHNGATAGQVDNQPGRVGLVHAVDVTHDPPVFDAHAYAEQVRQRCASGQERRIAYIVSHDFAANADRIASPSLKVMPGAGFGKRWQWRRKAGGAHANHAHYSIVYETWAEQSSGPLFSEPSPSPEPAPLEELMGLVVAQPSRVGVPAGRTPTVRLYPDKHAILCRSGARLKGDTVDKLGPEAAEKYGNWWTYIPPDGAHEDGLIERPRGEGVLVCFDDGSTFDAYWK